MEHIGTHQLDAFFTEKHYMWQEDSRLDILAVTWVFPHWSENSTATEWHGFHRLFRQFSSGLWE